MTRYFLSITTISSIYLVKVDPFILGDEVSLFLLVMTSNSSKSVELWLVGDHGSCCLEAVKLTAGVATGVPHGSVLGAILTGAHGSANEGTVS